jgi:hypothetical protein
MSMKLKSMAYHRNGISGAGFWAIVFSWRDNRKNRQMVATVFDDPGECAVLDTALLAKGNVEFGKNSWRGDYFEDQCREWIAECKWPYEILHAASRPEYPRMLDT